MSQVIFLIQERILNAIFTIPSLEDWATLLLWSAIYTAIALLLGFKFDFLQISITKNWNTILQTIMLSLVFPSIVEEIIFRVILIPHPLEQASLINLSSWILISLLLFLISHPINGLTFSPGKKTVFFQPIFLVLAFLLGVVCTIVYYNSGSLWMPVIFHWLIVCVWLNCLGGLEKLNLI